MEHPTAGPSKHVKWESSTSRQGTPSSRSSSPDSIGRGSPIRPLVYPAKPMPQTVQLPPISSFYPIPLYAAAPAAPQYIQPPQNGLQLTLYEPHYSTRIGSTNPSPMPYREFRPHFWAPEDGSYNTPRYPPAIANGPRPVGFDPNWTPPSWPPRTQLAPHPSPNRAQAQTTLPRAPPSSSQPPGFLIAPYLAPNMRHPEHPHLVWNVTESPERCKRITSEGVWAPFMGTGISAAQATSPPYASFEVWLPYMRPCWGPAMVSASSRDRGPGAYVTSADVLAAIYNYLQTPIHSEDVTALMNLPQGGATYTEICNAFEKRCASAPGLPGFERNRGVRRVDFLRDEVGYWGMWQKKKGDGSWCLMARFCAPLQVQGRVG